MTAIDGLIKKHGSVEAIPDQELADIGLVRFGGELIRRTTYDKMQNREQEDRISLTTARPTLNEMLDYREVSAGEWAVAKEAVETGRKSIDLEMDRIFDSEFGRSLSGEFQREIRNKAFYWLEDEVVNSTIWDEDESVVDTSPHLVLLREGRQYFSARKDHLSPRFLGKMIERRIRRTLSGETQYIDAIASGYADAPNKIMNLSTETSSDSGLTDIEIEALEDEWRSFKPDDVPEEIREEFERKYGSSQIASGDPFESYAFRRVVLEEENPQHFFGRRIYGIRKGIIDRFKDLEGIEEFADQELFFGAEPSNVQQVVSDGLPHYLEQFIDGVERGVPVALAYLDLGFIDDYVVRDNPEIRSILTKIHRIDQADEVQKRRKTFEFLEDKVKSEGRKSKLMRLGMNDDEFKGLLRRRAEKGLDYADSLPQNQETTDELRDLGVNTEIFYRGIAPKSFVLESGKVVDRNEVRKGIVAEYRASLEQLLSGEIIHSRDRLVQKIVDVLTNEGVKIPEGQDGRSYILDLDNDDQIRRVCVVASEYASSKPNVKDELGVEAVKHHLKAVNRFLKGESSREDEQARSNSYTIRIAEKDPFTDVDIGNNGGCCIGVYGEDDSYYDWTVDSFVEHLESFGFSKVDGNGQYMPFYLKDRATHFAEIYKGNERVGMALMFAGRNERNEPVLAVNSIETGERLRDDSNRRAVLDEAIKYLADYGSRSGFKHVIMGRHHYNPAGHESEREIDFETFTKVDHWGEEFYSDILDDGVASTSGFSLL